MENIEHKTAKLLVIDDSENGRSLLKRRLAMNGHEVVTAGDKHHALEILEKVPIDVILLNMVLDGRHSLDLLSTLKSHKSYQNIPVIMISANDDTDLLVKCIETGAEDYLVKPLNQTILRARLSNCIARKEAYDKEIQYLAQIKQGQKQIAAQEKMASVGVLVTSISNELKKPLNFIINFANVTADICGELINLSASKPNITDSDKVTFDDNLKTFQKNLIKISEYGQDADQLIRFMIDQSNVDTSKKQPANINKVINQTINMLLSAYKSKGVNNLPQITTDLSTDIPHILLSVQSFSKVIYNILDNAVDSVMKKFQDQMLSEVKIVVKNHLNDIEILIRDNGVGIKDMVKAKIFEPFFTTKEGSLNPGLGLSTALEIVQDLKGSLTVNSVENEFAEFKIILPKTDR